MRRHKGIMWSDVLAVLEGNVGSLRSLHEMGVSIGLVITQPLAYNTFCTLCVFTAIVSVLHVLIQRVDVRR